MNIDLIRNDLTLRAEADELLHRKGLRNLLEQYASISVVGSYALRLMVWRDLDIAMNAPKISVAEFFDLGKRLADVLVPWKMFFTDNRNHASPTDPDGLYWGIRLGDIRRGSWKIDLWAFDSEQFRGKVKECDELEARLNPENRLIILDIKSRLWDQPGYRDVITSKDIYDAVLDHHVRSPGQFQEYIRRKSQGHTGPDGT